MKKIQEILIVLKFASVAYNTSLAIQAQASASAKKARVGGFISDIINNHLLTDYSENYLIFILIYMCTHSQHNSFTDQRHISQ